MTPCLSGRVADRALRAKFDHILPHFDERRRRLYLASEATALGRGGIVRVAAASGTSAATIRRGMAELAGCSAPTLRVRAPGAGRKRLTDTDPGLLPGLESLIEPHTRGDPVSPLRWTTLSLRALASTLTAQGHPVSASTVGHLLHTLGYSLQGTAKTTEGISHPDRDARFTHLNATAAAFLNDAQPVISVDTKAKEWLGNRDRPGRTWRPGKNAIRVDCHTFTTNDQPMAIPYGIYDIANNSGWLNVGTDHDTAEFAVESIRRWWQRRGRADHPNAGRLLITADSGGSNDPRRWTWKSNLAAFARESGLEITVCHLPPGTSKWNKIEHRMFCHITANWRGRPLTSYQVVLETIAATTTKTGLTIGAELDTGSYDLGISVTPAEFHALRITPNTFHGDWNYTLSPVPPRAPDAPATTHRTDPALTAMLTDPALTGMSRLHHENNREIREKVTSGELPVGMLALAAGRSYAEACMRRTAERPVAYAADIPLDPAETLAVQTARNGRVMLDTSAAATLALLEGGVSEQLIGHSQVVMTTDQLLADALQAKESIALRSDMTLAWDERSANAAVLTSTPEQLAALRSTAARLVEIMQSAPRVSRPELRSLPRLPSGRRGTAWLTAVDYAKEHGHILWCDDRVLRAVARSQGVAAFGTLALIDACMQGNLMAPREGLVIKAELLRNYYVDIPFSADLYGAAAQADSWQAKAVAVAVSRPSAWSDAQAAAAFALHAASQIIGSLPHEASAWLSAAYAGLYRATLPSHRPRNLQVFSWQVLTQPWISASSLPFVLAGLHAGSEDVADTEAPLQAALTQYYGALIDQVGHIAAASTLMSLFALTDEKDKATAARTVLTHRAR